RPRQARADGHRRQRPRHGGRRRPRARRRIRSGGVARTAGPGGRDVRGGPAVRRRMVGARRHSRDPRRNPPDRGGKPVISVLVVDDEQLVRSGLRMILESAPDVEVVGEAADGAEAVERARELRPDVVLLDIRMPGVDGLTAAARLAELPDPPRVVLLTTFDLDEYV